MSFLKLNDFQNIYYPQRHSKEGVGGEGAMCVYAVSLHGPGWPSVSVLLSQPPKRGFQACPTAPG